MSDRLQELAVFVRAAESGSFSRAARELGLSQPSVSRIIGELEARLGVTLLLRTTRRIAVTDAGALFLDRAREILAEIEDAEDAARGVDSLRGTIRLAVPVVYGTREIIPRLAKFLALHPEYSPVPGRSVALSWVTAYWRGVSWATAPWSLRYSSVMVSPPITTTDGLYVFPPGRSPGAGS